MLWVYGHSDFLFLLVRGPPLVVRIWRFGSRLKETKMLLPHPRVKLSIVGSLRDREVACSASDRQGSNFESCVWRTVSSHSSHHTQKVLLAQFSLHVHKCGVKPDSFHFYFDLQTSMTTVWLLQWWGTRMIASSSTFRPNPGRDIRDLFRQLHAIWHGTEALVYSNHPREAAAFSYLVIISGLTASVVPWYPGTRKGFPELRCPALSCISAIDKQSA